MPSYTLRDVYRIAKEEPHRRQELAWLYNTLDCTGTVEIGKVLLEGMTPAQRRTYSFERACQSPAMAMMRRGVRVNIDARTKALREQRKELTKTIKALNKDPLIKELWDGKVKNTKSTCSKSKRKDGRHSWPRGVDDKEPGKCCTECGAPRWLPAPFNPGSPDQCFHLFYDLCDCKTELNKKHKVTTDDEAIQRIGKKYPHLLGVCTAIAACRDAKKQIGFLSADLSPDNRYRSTFNIGAAWTGRQSSSAFPIRAIGGNLQNIGERHRHMFVADYSKRVFYADLKTAESQAVAYLSGDERYIEAHKSGDPHTYVCRMVWPNELPWTGDIKKDKKIAKGTLPPWDPTPGHDYRFYSKKTQHGCNYGLHPAGLAIIEHIPYKQAEHAYNTYHGEFPGIRAWQEKEHATIRESGLLVNPLGRGGTLFGRPWDEHTYKQGLSYKPQGLVADVIGIAEWLMWQKYDPELIWLLAQVHDALLGEFDDNDEAQERALQAIKECMSIPIPVTDIRGITRTMTIGVEVAVGYNWGHFNDDPKHGPINLKGIKEVEL